MTDESLLLAIDVIIFICGILLGALLESLRRHDKGN